MPTLTGMGNIPGNGGGSSAPPDFSKAFIALGDDGKPYVPNPGKLWREVQELRDDALSARKPHERLWALCWMFYKGDQWRKPAPQPDWNIIRINVGKKPKITINKILPMVQTRRAHVLKNRPTGVVMPATTDEEDRNAARIAQDVLNYDMQHLHNWEILDTKLSLCMFVTGNAFKKVFWDPTKGRMKERNRYEEDPLTGQPLLRAVEPPPMGHILGADIHEASESGDADDKGPAFDRGARGPDVNIGGEGSPEEEEQESPDEEADEEAQRGGQEPILESQEQEPEGDVVIQFVNPEEILPEPAATSLDDCERLLQRTLKPLKWVRDTYKEAAENVQPINMRTDRGKSLAQGAKLFGLTEREIANRVEVLEAWFRPSEDYPDGLHAVWADDKLMAAGPTPPAHEHIPFVHYQEIDTDEFWGLSSVSQTIDPQKALNLAVSRDEFMRQRLRPKLMAATDAGIDESAYSNDDSEIVFVHHPFYPRFTEPPTFQRDEKAVEYFAKAVDDIGGSADIMRGQISGGDVRSGRMVNYLQEYAGTVLSGPARFIERGEEKTGNMILRLRKHYTEEPRLYYIVGRDKSVEVRQFIGSDIEGAADYMVQAGSALPMSLAEKRDMVFSMVEKGIMMPGDPRILKLLGMPSDMEELFDEDQLDRDNATEEDHRFLAMGKPIQDPMLGPVDPVARAYELVKQQHSAQAMGTGMDPSQLGIEPQPSELLDILGLKPRDFENHQVHIIQHNKNRKTKAYRNLPKAAQALYDEHVDLHAMFLLPPPPPPGEPAPAPGGPPGGPPEHQNRPRPRTKGAAPSQQQRPGSPGALQGRPPPGSGGAGGQNAQGNQERSSGMRPTPSPPGANNHHLM